MKTKTYKCCASVNNEALRISESDDFLVFRVGIQEAAGNVTGLDIYLDKKDVRKVAFFMLDFSRGSDICSTTNLTRECNMVSTDEIKFYVANTSFDVLVISSGRFEMTPAGFRRRKSVFLSRKTALKLGAKLLRWATRK